MENTKNVHEKVTEMIKKYEVYSDNNVTDLRLLGLDSLKIISLIVDIETEFDIQFMDDELIVDNFSTVDLIASQIERKRFPSKAE